MAADAEQARSLLNRLAAVRARATEGELLPRSLTRAGHELLAVEGLLALAEGDRSAAESALKAMGDHQTPELRALRGGCAALRGDAQQAVRDLSGALSRVRRADLRSWRLRAIGRVGLDAELAPLALADLKALEAAGVVRPVERQLGVRAHLALGQLVEAERALARLEDAPVDLAWAVALVVGDRQLGEDPQAVLERLAALPPQDAPDPRREAMAARTLQIVRSVVAKVGSRYKLETDERELVMVGLRLAFLLRPRDPPADILEPLMDKATSFKGSGDSKLAHCVADVCPTNKDVQLAAGYLAQRYSSQSAQRKCLPYLRRALELASDPAERSGIQLGICLLIGQMSNRGVDNFRQEECEEAIRLAGNLLPRVDDPLLRAEVLNARAVSLRCLGDHAAALRDVNDAIELAGDMPGLRLTRMRIRYELGRKRGALDDAYVYAQHHAAGDPSIKSDHAVLLVWTYGRELGESAKMLDTLRSLLRGRGHLVGWWVRLAFLELQAGDVELAVEHLDEAVRKLKIYRSSYVQYPEYGLALKALAATVREQGAAALPQARAFVDMLERVRLKQSFWAMGY